MYSKFFTRLFLLIGIIGMFSVPLRAEEVTIGSGTTTNAWLPSHSYYKYSLTQQIYTAEEIGGAGTINSIAFYNGGTEKTRTYDVYLVNTEKSSFSGSSDWVSISSNDLVFSGSVTMTANGWTTISFTSTFDYVGDNLAVVVNDKTGSYSQGMECRVFTPSGDQGVVSLYASKDSNNYDLSNPGNASGTVTYKNQIILDIEMASVTCAKPKNFTASNIAAHTATLTWTAGAEGQSNWDVYVTTTATDVPDENTLPTYLVTECTKSLSGLTTQTTYYAYVRSACGGDDGNSKWASTSFTTTREALTIDAENPYSQDFETNNDWSFANGTFTNQWCWGSATNNGGEKAMYISKDGGTTYEYAHNTLVVYASKLFSFAQGTYTFSFDWNANGEGSYDFLRVALVPGDRTFTAGGSLLPGVSASALPDTWIALDGGSKLNLSDNWQTKVTEAALSGTYTMVFLWRNDNSGGNQPPAAIDNISISYMTCPRPTNLTASNVTGRTAVLTWKENGTADNWTLQYATDASFSANLVEISDGFIVSGNNVGYGLTGLNGETKYYVRVKSNCDSSWSDVINFTTTATCEKPTLSYVANSNTAHTGSVSWTGDADGYELIYSTAYTFEPGDEGVTQINLGSVNTYTLQDLDPETTYRIKVRANCGEDDGYSAWSNQVNFTTTATCVAPSGLAATATATTITLSWTAGATGQDAWDIRYKTGSDDYTYVHLDGQTTTNYTITNLTPVTTYSVNVRAYCSDEDQSKWGYSTNQNSDLSVSTECAAIALPYSYGFEENLNTAAPYSSSYPMPKCWNAIRYQYGSYPPYTYYPYVCSTTNNSNYGPRTGGKFLLLYKTQNLTNEIAVLPEIDANIKNVQLKFWGRNGNGSSAYPEVLVGVMTDPSNASSFTQVKSVSVSTADYQEYIVDFSTYTGNGNYIAFKLNPAYSSYSYTYFSIDDITVEEIPSCLVPMGLEATINGANEATLSWTAGGVETAWNVQYKMASESDWSEPIAVNETSYTLTGLQRATAYEARVQANCATDDQSDWIEVSFTTECGIWPINAQNSLFEDFENVGSSDFPPTCWEKFSHEMSGCSYWYLNSNNGLGSSAAYSSWNQGYAFLVMPKMHIDGDAILSFDYLIGSGDYEESCSVVVSTGEMTYNDFDHTIWEATGSNSGNANATVSLASFNGEDIYVAFKFKGSGTSGCTWYIDNVKVAVPVNQTVELANGLNWWSTNLDITLDDLKSAIVAALGANGTAIIKSQSTSIIYSNGMWIPESLPFDIQEMYKIQVSEACEITLTGILVNPSEKVLTINPGNNWIGFPSSTSMTVTEAFAGLNPENGDVVKSQTGSSVYNNGIWIGTVGTLEPGQGYLYHSEATSAKTFTFPTNAK
ncbi:MAG: fibronectin type III domain-containing protein [Bacteroidales bacterium]|nr:fibronectin type III domain-containing protein [Bacteroidales bacterium]